MRRSGKDGNTASITGTVAVWSPPSMNGSRPGRHQEVMSARAASSCSRGGAPSGSSQSPRSQSGRSSRSRPRPGEYVSMESEARRRSRGPPSALAQVDAALERDAIDDDPGLGERPSTGDERRRGRTQRPVASPALNEVVFGEQGDGG